MATHLITGSSRGLGLALVELLSSFPTSEVGTIFAAARTESDGLSKLIVKSEGRVVFVKLEVTSDDSIENAVAEVKLKLAGKGLDVLINNAGIMKWSTGGITKMTDLQEHLMTNVIGVQNVTAAFMPLLEMGKLKKIANISTTLGSIANADTFKPHGVHSYAISKAALNMLTVQYALDYASQGFIIFSISPGWLRTDLGGSTADLDVEVGAQATLDKIISATKEQNGAYLNIHIPGMEKREGPNQYDGLNPPW